MTFYSHLTAIILFKPESHTAARASPKIVRNSTSVSNITNSFDGISFAVVHATRIFNGFHASHLAVIPATMYLVNVDGGNPV